MVRAPCCVKMGIKKGPWTSEEDEVLVNYIQQHGHGNWRALPRHAGLLRCGKSCRLRWTNYLKPDIKRGNFSKEEEEAIIELHANLGNRWSAIAAKLPGRTDNEIKNVWHTHLKKRVRRHQDIQELSDQQSISASYPSEEKDHQWQRETLPIIDHISLVSSQQSDISSSVMSNNTSGNNYNVSIDKIDSPDYLPEISESFWSEIFSTSTDADEQFLAAEDATYCPEYDFPAVKEATYYPEYDFPLSPILTAEPVHALDMKDDMDFWYNVFKRAGEYSSDLPRL